MIEVPIITTYNGTGVKKATADLGYLETGAAKLGSTVSKSFAAFAIGAGALSLLKSSVSAFAQDQKQIEILNNSLKNVGFGSASAGVDQFISSLALASGVAKSDLIPAFQNLLLSTGSVSSATDALNLAMNVSAGTGKDLQTVTTAMSKAYLGNTTSLTRLGAGLDKVLLKSGDMVAINERLATLFKGDASIAANSLSGEMARLGQAAEAAKVSIGTNLFNAFGQLDSKGDGVKSLAKAMNGLASAVNLVVDAFAGWALIFAKIEGSAAAVVNVMRKAGLMPSPSAGTPTGMLGPQGPPAGMIGPQAPGPWQGPVQTIPAWRRAEMAAAAAAAEKKKEAEAQAYALLVKKNALDKANYAIMQLSNKFDMQRIELNAALHSATDEQTRADIKGKIALLDAQDKLTLATGEGGLAAADAAITIANGALKNLQTLDALAQKHNEEVAKIDTVTKAFTDLGFVTTDLAATFSANALDMRTLHDSYAGGSGNGIANSNIDTSNMGKNGQDTHGGNGTTTTPAPTIIINTPAVITSTTVDPIVQAAIDAITRNGYVSSRAAGTNGWQ